MFDFAALTNAKKPLLMGILNITPDSFHDGGAYLHPQAALTRVRKIIEEGADIIDIGAASSRPGHTPLGAEEELARLTPLLQALIPAPLPLSVDTDKPEVAEAALKAGVDIINYSGGELDKDVFALAARYGCGLVMMHRAGVEGQHPDIVAEAERYFRDCVELAGKNGVAPGCLALDPGLGFDKDAAENMALLQALPRLRRLGRPLLLGFSHKRFVAALSGEIPGQAPAGNSAMLVYSLLQGADIVRMHDISSSAALLRAARTLFADKKE